MIACSARGRLQPGCKLRIQLHHRGESHSALHVSGHHGCDQAEIAAIGQKMGRCSGKATTCYPSNVPPFRCLKKEDTHQHVRRPWVRLHTIKRSEHGDCSEAHPHAQWPEQACKHVRLQSWHARGTFDVAVGLACTMTLAACNGRPIRKLILIMYICAAEMLGHSQPGLMVKREA